MSLMLVLSLVSMLLPHAVMAMPMSMPGATQQMSVQHATGRVMYAVSPNHVIPHPCQHGQCHCAAHCGLCSVCHSALSFVVVAGFSGVCAVPDGPRQLSLANIYLSPDPHPPRV